MFELVETRIAGSYIVKPKVVTDARGRFMKFFHAPAFQLLGLPTEFAEAFSTSSHKGVVRGLHFQRPPSHQAKLLHCVQGQVLDVVVDLRVGSPTYHRVSAIELNDATPMCLYLPPGLAHGFCTLSMTATLSYMVTCPHCPSDDQGIRWDSIDFSWPVSDPILSERDRDLPRLADFVSQFVYG